MFSTYAFAAVVDAVLLGVAFILVRRGARYWDAQVRSAALSDVAWALGVLAFAVLVAGAAGLPNALAGAALLALLALVAAGSSVVWARKEFLSVNRYLTARGRRTLDHWVSPFTAAAATIGLAVVFDAVLITVLHFVYDRSGLFTLADASSAGALGGQLGVGVLVVSVAAAFIVAAVQWVRLSHQHRPFSLR